MQCLTDFADQAVILPLVFAVALVSAAQGWWRGALAWGLVVPGALASLLALKLVAYAHGFPWPVGGVHSPSGHTGSAAVAYAGVAVLLGLRWATVPLAVAVAAGMGASRLVLGAHTPGDTMVGGVVGVAAVVALVALAGPRPRGLARWPLAMAVAAVLVAFHGRHLPVENGIRGVALVQGRAATPPAGPGLDTS